MCTTGEMHQCPLPTLLSPPCLARSSSKDAGSSLTDLGTMFVATMVDAKDFIEQLESTFCNELWPVFCAEMANFRSREIEFDMYVDEITKQREERELLELGARRDREAERVRLLGEFDVLRTELELEKVRCKSALEEAEQRTQALANEVERLQEAAKLSETKKLLLQEENQRLTRTRAVCEKSQVLHTRRLSLKKHEKLPGNNSPRVSLAGQAVEPADVASCENPQGSDNKDLKYPCDFQRQPILQECNSDIDKGVESHACDREATKQTLGRSTPVNMEADNVNDMLAASASLERHPHEGKSQSGLAKESEAADALEVECFQRPKDDCDAEPDPGPSGAVDSDETVMGSVQPDSLVPDAAKELPVIRISVENEASPCYEPLQPVRVVANNAIRTGPVAHVDKDRSVAQTGASLALNPRRPPSFKPTSTSHKLVNRSKDHPWRQTRSRAEPCEGDPHDSFLDTPREKVLANLVATVLEQARTADSHAVQPEVSVINGELVSEGLEAQEKATSTRQDLSSTTSRLVTGGTITGDHDRNKKSAVNSNPPPVYKFNEPVRKKRDRELLLATDCKQCKKFYDAVEAEDASGTLLSRCEHHAAVSKHRYKAIPPPTPDGFWKLGFDTPTGDKTFSGSC